MVLATADAPHKDVVRLIAGDREANAEVHAPRERGIIGRRRRRPIAGRLDVAKGMLSGQIRIAARIPGIVQACQLVHRRQPPALLATHRAPRALKSRRNPRFQSRQR